MSKPSVLPLPKRAPAATTPPEYGASVCVVREKCGMLKIGDGFGIHLNRKPKKKHLRMMRLFFGWTWVEDMDQLVDRSGDTANG